MEYTNLTGQSRMVTVMSHLGGGSIGKKKALSQSRSPLLNFTQSRFAGSLKFQSAMKSS